jgi:hypothetical protein
MDKSTPIDTRDSFAHNTSYLRVNRTYTTIIQECNIRRLTSAPSTYLLPEA